MKKQEISKYSQREREKKAEEKKSEIRLEIKKQDNAAAAQIEDLKEYLSELDPQKTGYSNIVYRVKAQIKELEGFRTTLAEYYSEFNGMMSTMSSTDILTDGFLDNEWEEFIMPKLVPESSPGLQLSPSVPAWKIKQNEKGQKYKEILEEIKKTPFYSGGEAPPKAKPTPKPESKPQTTQPTQTTPTPPEPDPEDVSLAQVLDETEAKIPD